MNKKNVAAGECAPFKSPGPHVKSYKNRDISLGSLQVARALPIHDRRMVGPWCFLDRFGPLTFSDSKPMDILPHPHIGIQTVTWLLEGEVQHNDSLGSEAVARPGGVNVMTAGKGIAHAEQTPSGSSGRLNGAQLWVAIPDKHRHVEPSFVGIPEVPVAEQSGAVIRVFAGSLGGVKSPAAHYSEIVGADIDIHAGETVEIELNPNYEHAVLLLAEDCSIEDQPLRQRMLYYLGPGRSSLSLRSGKGGRLLLIGGPPFPETILMWWNFVARSREEIADARADWESHRRFGEVQAYGGIRLKAPNLGRFARPNAIS